MSVTLSCDHRAVDGALGAELIGAFKTLIENPVMMVVTDAVGPDRPAKGQIRPPTKRPSVTAIYRAMRETFISAG